MYDHRRQRAGEASGPATASASAPGRSTLVEAQAASTHVPRLQLRDIPQNVDLSHLNHHPGFDANRLGHDHGKNFHTTKPTALYQLDGTRTFDVPAGSECEINAGAITRLVLRGAGEPARAPDRHGHAVDCVFIFNVKVGRAWTNHGGWMPASALPHVVDREQHQLAGAIEHQRGDAHHAFGHGIPLRPGVTAETDGTSDLYTYPRQTTVQNKAKYYYNNLALNLPDTGGERVGVLTASIPGAHPELHGLDPYREFFAEEPRREAAIPLYQRGASHPAGRSLHFIYGYVKNDSGGRVYGWINKACLAIR